MAEAEHHLQVPGTPSATARDGGAEPRMVTRDGAEWAAFAIASFGLRIGVELDNPAMLDPVLRGLPPCTTLVEPRNLDSTLRAQWMEASESPARRDGYSLFLDGQFKQWMPDSDYAIDAIESRLQIHIAEFAHPHLFVHAGVVGWQGRAIVLPGRSHAGKSTLVKALVDAGANYLSDEYAVFDLAGRVHAFPRRLSLREGPLGPTGRIDLAHRLPDDGGIGAGMEVGLVALLEFDRDRAWEVESLSEAEAIMAMCEHTVAVRRRPQDALDILGQVARSAVAVRGMRGEVADAVERTLALGPCQRDAR